MQPARPVGISFCVDSDQLESAVECGMLRSCTSVEKLIDKALRSFVNSEAQETQTSVTENDHGKLLETVLKMDMTVKSAIGRMKVSCVPVADCIHDDTLFHGIQVPVKH